MQVRLCPSPDGTFKASAWDKDSEDWVEIDSRIACMLLAIRETTVEVAVNDLDDVHSHYESDAVLMRRIVRKPLV